MKTSTAPPLKSHLPQTAAPAWNAKWAGRLRRRYGIAIPMDPDDGEDDHHHHEVPE